MVEYVGRCDFKRNPVMRRGDLAPGQSASGYGAKISTDYMIRLPTSGRWYRVYSVCYSNAASFYILSKGRKLFVRESQFPTESTYHFPVTVRATADLEQVREYLKNAVTIDLDDDVDNPGVSGITISWDENA